MRNPFARRRPIPPRPRVILHIGRNKAASTTIQDFCLAARQDFAAEGVAYALFGHLKDSQPGVPGFQTFDELAAYAAGHPDQTHLVSNEFMFAWPDAYTQAAAKALAHCEVTVLAYLRPYDAWMRSAYAEETRRGMNRRDIDAYLADMQDRISCWAALQSWGACFGWNCIRVRTLDRAALEGGDVLADFAQAIGVPRPITFHSASNISPHWLELELARVLAPADRQTEWIETERLIVEPLMALMATLATSAPDVAYLTPEQSRSLQTLYEQDLDRIEAATNWRAPRPLLTPTPERVFIPSLASAPPVMLQHFFEAARSTAFASRHPEAAARAHELEATLPRS